MLDNNEVLDYEEVEQTFTYATNTQRFATYIIDTIASFIFAAVCLQVVKAANMNSSVVETIGVYLFIILYYTFMEHFANGKTLGKMLLKTRVINKHGHTPSLLNCFGRSCARFLPFNSLSKFFDHEMWHDKVSGTQVVQD